MNRVCSEPSAGISSNAGAFGTRPEAIRGARHRDKAICRDSFGIGAVEHHEPDSIKTNKTVESCQPQVTVCGAAHRCDFVYRQTIVRGPVVNRNLGESRQVEAEEQNGASARDSIEHYPDHPGSALPPGRSRALASRKTRHRSASNSRTASRQKITPARLV